MTMHDLDCETVDALLSDYLEGDLTAADRRHVDAHVASCVRCTALVRDLQAIRAGAADLPELSPSGDLWNGIARRIETPVTPFVAPPVPNVAVPRRRFDRLKTAAIAAALVAITAGVTYEITTRAGTSNIAAVTPSAKSDSTTSPATLDTTPHQTVAAAPEPAGPDSSTPPLASDPSVGAVQAVRNTPGTVTTSHEIDRLRTIFLRNRSQLDPRTAAIIETNLKVIDDAIAQSKAALAQDPASRFLSNQLNSALDKKLELLRTAALLPSRT
jgi:hypothetical protein